jgi:uncharacterized membrane protein
MLKQDFLSALREGLKGLPEKDIEERITFYGEMIDDRIEEGLSEEEAVTEIGTVDAVVQQIVAETPLTRIVGEKIKTKRRMRAWEIILIVLGFPIWFSLLAAAGAVLLSLYIVLWVLVLVLWAVEIVFWVCAVALLVAGVGLLISGETPAGLCALGAALLLAGLSIFLFFGCIAACKGAVKLTKKIAIGVKNLFVGKERTK